jgi:hypothetical protein
MYNNDMSTQPMNFDSTQPLPVITPTTVGTVRKLMEEDGVVPQSNEDVSEYVEKLVARESFFRVVDKIQERNKEVDPRNTEAAVDEAVDQVKNQHRKLGPSADRS